MFPGAYYPSRFFAGRYWPKEGVSVPPGAVDPAPTCDYDAGVVANLLRDYDAVVLCPTGEEFDPV